ncbi:hypothetical protein WH47_02363 [Habropoda laboriosa]|uniref:Uncharacterized protein n=1 Tax=Habropoda laboriosa TaxID=597456 RepID=A0A0L7RKB8_9HYME|nr:hypothetical protein WH47_02363 [Habropoda laboriosa]
MIKRLEKYLDKKELLLNVGKTKVMIFRGVGGRAKRVDWRWKSKTVEEVKEFNYLGVRFQRNGNMAGHIKERIKKANVTLNQVWGIGERKFKTDFRMRMYLFDMLVLGVLMYGVELWGFKERAEIEKIQVRYIKWTLGLDIRTPGYLVLEESKREKLRVKAGIRAWKF